MGSKLVLGVRDIIRVYFWCQHVENYNYHDSKTYGVVWPFILTSFLVSIFIHGCYMFMCDFVGIVGEKGFWLPYTFSWFLSAYITYIVCIKSEGFKHGEAYFDSVEKNARCSAARSFSFLFTAICFSVRIAYFVVGLLGSLFR
ncbi:hypothetical protein ACOIWI_000499 [Vibrio vulnificus]|nr:hypothetical protein [Vibrio vulnificus]